MNCHCQVFILFVGVLVFQVVSGTDTTCCLNNLNCGCKDPNMTCVQDKENNSTGICKCKTGYGRDSTNKCIQKNPVTPIPQGDKPTTPVPEHSSNVSGSTIAASILIPLVLIVAVVGLVYTARRYQWLHRLRTRRYNDVRIGQEDDDDPPIA